MSKYPVKSVLLIGGCFSTSAIRTNFCWWKKEDSQPFRLGFADRTAAFLNYVPYQWRDQLPAGLVEFVAHQEVIQNINLQEIMAYLGFWYWQKGDEI